MATMRIFGLDGTPKAPITGGIKQITFVTPTRGPGQHSTHTKRAAGNTNPAPDRGELSLPTI